VLAQITKDNFFLWKDKDKNLVRVSTITNNKEITNTTNIRQGVLAQITKDNFFLWKDKDKNLVRVSTITNNKEITRNI